MTSRFMSPADFRAAMKAVEETGISQTELTRLLECSNNQIPRWATIGAPRHIALALAAVLTDLAPWVPEGRKAAQRAPKRWTNRQLIFKALEHFETGATVAEIRDFIWHTWARALTLTTTISPEMTRLLAKGLVAREGHLWSLKPTRDKRRQLASKARRWKKKQATPQDG